MTVRELIEKLQECEPDAEVMWDGGMYGGTWGVDNCEQQTEYTRRGTPRKRNGTKVVLS